MSQDTLVWAYILTVGPIVLCVVLWVMIGRVRTDVRNVKKL